MLCKLRLMTLRLAMLFLLIAKKPFIVYQRWNRTNLPETALKLIGLEYKLLCMELLAVILPCGQVKKRPNSYLLLLTCSSKSVRLSSIGSDMLMHGVTKVSDPL